MTLPATAAFTNNSGGVQTLQVADANWTIGTGAFSINDIDDFVCTNAGGVISSAYWNADTFGTDHYSQAVLKGMGTGGYCGVCVRHQSGAVTMYAYHTHGTDNYLLRYNAGVETILDQTAQTWASNDVLKLEVSGTGATVTVTVKRAAAASPTSFSTVVSFNDTTGSRITTAGKPGLFGYGGNLSASIGVDDWTADNLAAPATVDQEGYRWRADDGNETTASWLAAQDTGITRALSTATRLRALVNATGDLATTQFQLEHKLSTDADSTYKKVEVVGAGAITYGAIGSATTTGTTAPTVAYPAGIAAGDLLVMAIVNRPNASVVTQPSGWDALANNTTTGGAGSEASGTGVVRVTVFTRVATGTESGSVSLAISGGTSVGAAIFRVGRTTGKDWAIALAIGSDNSAGTAWSVTFGSDPGVAAGDEVFVVSGCSEDTATFASEALSQTGITWGTVSEKLDQAVTTGNDCKLVVSQHSITSGTSSAAATFTMTSSGTNSANCAGCSIMIRLRQVDQNFQLALSSNITASGVNTTAQLTAPSGKTTGDFTTGRMQDDENPADTVDINADDYTEVEWCIAASALAPNGTYNFRVTKAGTAFDTYSVTPEWIIGSTGAGPIVGRPLMGTLVGGSLVTAI